MNRKKRKGCRSRPLFPLPLLLRRYYTTTHQNSYPEKASLGKEFYVLVLHLGRLLFLLILVSLWNLLLLFELVEGIEGRDWTRRRAVSSVGVGGSEWRTWLWNFSSWEQIFSWNYAVVVDGFRGLERFWSANGQRSAIGGRLQ
jgi:hypothetical protein